MLLREVRERDKEAKTFYLDFLDKRVKEVKGIGNDRVQIAIDSPPGQNPFGNAIFGNGVIQIQGGVMIAGGRGFNNAGNLPDLLDAKGNKFQVVQIPGLFTKVAGQFAPRKVILFPQQFSLLLREL